MRYVGTLYNKMLFFEGKNTYSLCVNLSPPIARARIKLSRTTCQSKETSQKVTHQYSAGRLYLQTQIKSISLHFFSCEQLCTES